jgi:hypothetical protein
LDKAGGEGRCFKGVSRDTSLDWRACCAMSRSLCAVSPSEAVPVALNLQGPLRFRSDSRACAWCRVSGEMGQIFLSHPVPLANAKPHTFGSSVTELVQAGSLTRIRLHRYGYTAQLLSSTSRGSSLLQMFAANRKILSQRPEPLPTTTYGNVPPRLCLAVSLHADTVHCLGYDDQFR